MSDFRKAQESGQKGGIAKGAHMQRLKARVAELEARVKELEGILLCDCGHLRSEHDDNDAPCHGGREGFKPGEGPYCMCSGFSSEKTT